MFHFQQKPPANCGIYTPSKQDMNVNFSVTEYKGSCPFLKGIYMLFIVHPDRS